MMNQSDIKPVDKQEKKDSQEQMLLALQKKYTTIQEQLVVQIKTIHKHINELQVNQQLTEQITEQENKKLENSIKKLLIIEKKIEVLDELREEEDCDKHTEQQFNECIEKSVIQYEPTQQQIDTRKQELFMDPNQSNWTDATQSQAGDDNIWVVDENIMEAMEHDSGQSSNSQNDSDKEEDVDEIDYNQLQSQFVVGEQSDHNYLYGKHDKFCVSVNGLAQKNLLFSGGGDDYLYLYNLSKDEHSPDHCIKPYHLVKHTQTINKIELSYTKEFIFSMTDNQVLCTDLKTSETKPLKTKKKKEIEEKKEVKDKKQEQNDQLPICSDMVCHHLGDVVALSNQFEIELYNIKGLKLYQTYYCQKPINSLRFTQNGKQIVLACEDNKIRLLTPKSFEFTTIGGINQHKNEISAMETKGNIILTGCIDGYIGVSSIKNNSIMTLIGTKQTEQTFGNINHLQFAGNYFIAGSSQDWIDWYDLTKTKKIFHSQLLGSPTDIAWQGVDNPHIYNVSTIKGYIYLYDCRNPLKELARTRAGNTIHKLWGEKHHLTAACEDGLVRYFDLRKLIN